MADFKTADICGASPNLNGVLEKMDSLKNSLSSSLTVDPSALASTLSSKVGELSSSLSGMIPELPSAPDVSLQAELTALSNINLSLPSGLLEYRSKLDSITNQFGDSLSSAGVSLDNLVSQVAPLTIPSVGGLTDAVSGAVSSLTGGLSGGGSSVDLCSVVPNFKLPDGATEAAEAAAEDGVEGGGGGDPATLAAAASDAEMEAKAQSQAKAEVQEEARRAAELLATLEDAAGGQEVVAEEAAAAYERSQTERENLLRFRGVRCKCVVQLLLIDSVEEVFFKHGHLLRCNQIEALLGALTRCHEFARNFNADIELRNELWSRVRIPRNNTAVQSFRSFLSVSELISLLLTRILVAIPIKLAVLKLQD